MALGFFQDFGPGRVPGEPPVDWVEGVAIIVAIFIVVCLYTFSQILLTPILPFPKVTVGSINDWQKERQFLILKGKKEGRGVKVIRSGTERIIDVKELLVGDIVLLEPGEIVPCDGVFISGHNVKCDESDATGESDAVKKARYEDCVALSQRARREGSDVHAFDAANANTDCFMISGSKVLDGYGKYVIITIGPNSFNGRVMMGTFCGKYLLSVPGCQSYRSFRSSAR